MTITLELDVDEALGSELERLDPECKKMLKDAVQEMLQNVSESLRLKKLRMQIDELKKRSGSSDFDPEMLYAILRREEY